MADPRRVLWVLIVGVGFTTIPSFLAYWTHTLWVAKCMFWLFIPAILFLHGRAWACFRSGAAPHALHVHRLSLLVAMCQSHRRRRRPSAC